MRGISAADAEIGRTRAAGKTLPKHADDQKGPEKNRAAHGKDGMTACQGMNETADGREALREKESSVARIL
jgi:hypothetical protein